MSDKIDTSDGIDWADVLLHAAGGVLMGAAIIAMYRFHMIDVWPFTVLFTLAFPLRELSQHNWDPRRLVRKMSIALEAWPASAIVLFADLGSRLLIGATPH